MCLVWLTKQFKHIRIHCQYLKIEQFHSEIQISSSSGELRRSDVSGTQGCMERRISQLHLLGVCRHECVKLLLSKAPSHVQLYNSKSDCFTVQNIPNPSGFNTHSRMLKYLYIQQTSHQVVNILGQINQPYLEQTLTLKSDGGGQMQLRKVAFKVVTGKVWPLTIVYPTNYVNIL